MSLLVGLDRLAMPVLFKEISTDLNLNVVQVGVIWGMDSLPALLISLPAGLFLDRFGVKRSLTLACILGGITCALRGLAANFGSLLGISFLFGLMIAIIPMVVSKTTILWFKKGQLGLTNALLTMTGYCGMMIATMLSATVLSPLLGGWRNVLFLYGVPGIIVGLLWWFTGRDPSKSELPRNSSLNVPFRQSISAVIHVKEVWILGLIFAAFLSAHLGMVGYLPLYLRNIGWSVARADMAVTVLTGASMVGMVPMVLLSNRLKSQKGILFLSLMALLISLALLPFIQGNSVLVLLIVSGFLRGGAFALFSILILQIKGLGINYGGTALGLSQTITMGVACLAPPLGNSFARLDPGGPFIFWAVLAALALPLFLMVREPTRAREETLEQV